MGVRTALWLCALVSGAPAFAEPGEVPRLCVEVLGEGPVDERGLLAAVRARIAREVVHVEPCGAARAPTFRVSVTFREHDRPELVLRGPALDARRAPFVGGLGREEIAQTLALTVADAVRQPLDALLVQLGHAVPAPVCPEVQPCPACACAEATPPAARADAVGQAGAGDPAASIDRGARPAADSRESVPAIGLGLRLEGGPLFGPMGASAWLALGGELALGPLWISPYVGVDPFGDDTTLTTVDVEVGLSVAYAVGPLRLGGGLAHRLTVVTISGTPRADGTTTAWTPGFGLLAGVTVLELGPLVLDVWARGWAWPEPARFRVEGVVVREEPGFEVAVFPSLSFRP